MLSNGVLGQIGRPGLLNVLSFLHVAPLDSLAIVLVVPSPF